jgi:hypothetical protein
MPAAGQSFGARRPPDLAGFIKLGNEDRHHGLVIVVLRLSQFPHPYLSGWESGLYFLTACPSFSSTLATFPASRPLSPLR